MLTQVQSDDIIKDIITPQTGMPSLAKLKDYFVTEGIRPGLNMISLIEDICQKTGDDITKGEV